MLENGLMPMRCDDVVFHELDTPNYHFLFSVSVHVEKRTYSSTIPCIVLELTLGGGMRVYGFGESDSEAMESFTSDFEDVWKAVNNKIMVNGNHETEWVKTMRHLVKKAEEK